MNERPDRSSPNEHLPQASRIGTPRVRTQRHLTQYAQRLAPQTGACKVRRLQGTLLLHETPTAWLLLCRHRPAGQAQQKTLVDAPQSFGALQRRRTCRDA
jgi:hypothetical protein